VNCRSEYHPKEGWYLDGHTFLMRDKLKRLINQVKNARMARLTATQGEIDAESSIYVAGGMEQDDEDESGDEEVEDNAGAMLNNFFDQLEGEEEFEILEEDD
jgi:hypothetical protein